MPKNIDHWIKRLRDYKIRKGNEDIGFGVREIRFYNVVFREELKEDIIKLIPHNAHNKKFFKFKPFRDIIVRALGLKPVDKDAPNDFLDWGPENANPKDLHLTGMIFGTLEDRKLQDGTELL